MKNLLSVLLLLCVGGFAVVGCSAESEEVITVRRVIPDSLKQIAADKIEAYLQSIRVQSRNDNEDWDDFMRAAKNTVIEIYGIPTLGIGNKYNYDWFVPYDKCSPSQKAWIDEYLALPR